MRVAKTDLMVERVVFTDVMLMLVALTDFMRVLMDGNRVNLQLSDCLTVARREKAKIPGNGTTATGTATSTTGPSSST